MKTKLTLFVAVLTFCSQLNLTGADLKKGLVAYYPFNGNSLDESGSANHAGVNGANFSLDRHGQSDRAYSFDGKGDVIQKEGGYKVLGSHSVSVWVRTRKFEDSPGEGGRYRRILVNKGGKDNGFGLSVIGQNQVGFGFYTTFKGVQHRAQFVAEKLLAEKLAADWIHVACVFRKDKSINIFINGEQKMPLGDPGGYYIENKNMFCIGNDSAPNRGCVGSIDDVRIYNRALSAEEVQALYELEKPKSSVVVDLTHVAVEKENAGWEKNNDGMVFSSGKPVAYVGFKAPVSRHYELNAEVTINRAKETTCIWLPIATGGSMRFDITGDNGNTESPTATISLSGSKEVPTRQTEDDLYKVVIGTPVKLLFIVNQSKSQTHIEVFRDDKKIYDHRDAFGKFAEPHRLYKNKVGLMTAYYTNSTFRQLKLRNKEK